MPATRESEILRAWLAQRDVPCPACGYNLRGLPTSVCSECGSPLKLAVAATAARRWSWPIAIGVLGGMLVFQALVAGTALAKLATGAASRDVWLDLATNGILLLVVVGYLRSCLRYRRRVWQESRWSP